MSQLLLCAAIVSDTIARVVHWHVQLLGVQCRGIGGEAKKDGSESEERARSYNVRKGGIFSALDHYGQASKSPCHRCKTHRSLFCVGAEYFLIF
jgi:hypothetical protein